MELYKKTCAAGDMNGCTMLGSAYIDGKDLPADTARGLGLLRKACAANLPAACAGLGVIYLDGRIAPADPAAAERFLGQACDSNEKNSCQLLQQLAQKRAAAGGGR